jgi:arabinogalactan oligomer/maltooligosaccharide transport system substrate-binding protein
VHTVALIEKIRRGDKVKKILSLLLTLVLVLGVLAACGPGEGASGDSTGDSNDSSGGEGTTEEGTTEDSNKPEKLTVWADKDKGASIEPALKSFEEKHGIKVEYKEVEMATKQREQLRLDGPAGTGPDVLTLPHDQIGQVAVEGLIAPLGVDSSVTDIYLESAIEAETYNGKLYGLPKATETPVFIYNKALMEKPPETFGELYEFSQEFTKDGQYGFLALWDNFYFSHAVTGGFGGYVFKNNKGTLDPTDIGLNNEGAVEGAKYIGKWYENIFPKGIVGETGGSAQNGLFADGKVASKMDGPWAFAGLKEAGIDFGVAPLPKLPNGEYPETFIGVKGWHISSFSENKDWATKLVVWLANTENSKARYEVTAEIPPIKTLIEDPIIAENDGAKAVAVQSSRGVPMPNIPEMSQVWGPMATALQLIATDKQDAKPALDEAVKTIKAQIKATK